MSFRHLWDVPADVPPAWAARRRLAEALRQLNERCVDTDASVDALSVAAAQAEAILAGLPAGRTSSAYWRSGAYDDHAQELIDRTALTGQSNPTAPPLTLTHDGTRSRCAVTLGERFVGAPGLAHGGVIASIYDQMMGHAVLWADRSGLTVKLAVRYRQPTPLHTPLVYRAWVTEVRGRNTLVEADCHRGDQLVSSCTGHFVRLNPDKARAVFGPAD